MALTLMPGEAEVTVELKVNLLAPASGDMVVAQGEVIRAGRTLTVCRGEAYAEQGRERVHVATMLATMVRRRGVNELTARDLQERAVGDGAAQMGRRDRAHTVFERASALPPSVFDTASASLNSAHGHLPHLRRA